jgi:hypothetical protein
MVLKVNGKNTGYRINTYRSSHVILKVPKTYVGEKTASFTSNSRKTTIGTFVDATMCPNPA